MLSVVIPCFNEEETIALLTERLRPVLDSLTDGYEVVFVDDGSTDATHAELRDLELLWTEARVLRLGRNVGHQRALAAGLDHARGDHLVTMDADLQDPPELIPTLLRTLVERNVDVVYARRSDRSCDAGAKRLTAAVYYWSIRRVTGVDLPANVGDFRILSRAVVEDLRQLPERHRVYRLLIPSLGYPSAVVDHSRAPRAGGQTKYSPLRMATLAVDSMTAFSTAPLRLATVIGVFTAAMSLLIGVGAVVAWIAGATVPGWTSIVVAVLFLGAIQLLGLGLLGEYVGRIHEQVQGRPLYRLAEDTLDASAPPVEPGPAWALHEVHPAPRASTPFEQHTGDAVESAP